MQIFLEPQDFNCKHSGKGSFGNGLYKMLRSRTWREFVKGLKSNPEINSKTYCERKLIKNDVTVSLCFGETPGSLVLYHPKTMYGSMLKTMEKSIAVIQVQ